MVQGIRVKETMGIRQSQYGGFLSQKHVLLANTEDWENNLTRIYMKRKHVWRVFKTAIWTSLCYAIMEKFSPGSIGSKYFIQSRSKSSHTWVY